MLINGGHTIPALANVNRLTSPLVKVNGKMKRTDSPPVSAEMAAHIRFLVNERGLFQHQAAALCGINQGRISEVMRGHRHPNVPPAQGAFPF